MAKKTATRKRVVCMTSIGRSLVAGDVCSYARKTTKHEINSELSRAGWKFSFGAGVTTLSHKDYDLMLVHDIKGMTIYAR